MSQSGFRVYGIAETRNERCLAYLETEHLKNIHKQNYWFKRKRFFKSVEFECQLLRGEGEFPRTKTMTISEMGKENKKLVLSFIKSLDEGKDRPLWRWKIKDLPKFKQIKREYMAS